MPCDACPSADSAPWRGEDETSEDPRALENQGFWAKLLIFAAGRDEFPGGPADHPVPVWRGKGICHPGDCRLCPGLSLGGTLLAGDKVTAIDGERIYVYSDVSLLLNLKQSGSHDLTVLRNGEKVELTNVPMELRGVYRQKRQCLHGLWTNFFP